MRTWSSKGFGTVLILMLVTLLRPNAVTSQELMGGSLNAKSLAPIDLSAPITIHIQNDAELKERLAQAIGQAFENKPLRNK